MGRSAHLGLVGNVPMKTVATGTERAAVSADPCRDGIIL